MKSPKTPLLIDDVLKQYWGYDSFRPMQREIIENIMSGKDTLALLPTGGGKSLTYQVPAMAMEGITIVITPLIALMKDQVDRLQQVGIKGAALHSGLSPQQISNIYDNCKYGSIKLLYVAPERIISQDFQWQIKRLNISLIAVDEAHCISQWGYDFRPSYQRIGELREVLKGVPILALTASATKDVCKDIMRNLLFSDEQLLVGDFSRKNLSYVVRDVDNKDEALKKILSNVDGSTIIYANTRLLCEKITELVKSFGFSATFYHGGLPYAERGIRQNEWVTNEKRIMVATNAFGMGIDKPDVRLVVHYTMCDCLEAYYQEAGRAGRDGKRGYAVLLTTKDDVERIRRKIESEFPSLDSIKEIYDNICSSLMIAYGDGEGKMYNFDKMEFCIKNKIFGGSLDKAIKLLSMNGYLDVTERMTLPSRIIFRVNRDELYRIRISNPKLDDIIHLLLRSYEGLFTDFQRIDEEWIAKVSGYKLSHVKELLATLWRLRIINYIPTNSATLLLLKQTRVPKEQIYISPQSYKYRRELYQNRFESMIRYSKSEVECRSKILVEYFGVEDSEACGACDNCLKQRKLDRDTEEKRGRSRALCQQIIDIASNNPQRISELKCILRANEEELLSAIEILLSQELIEYDKMGVVRLIEK